MEFAVKEEKRILEEAIQSLKEIYRIPLILFYFRDLSYNDISIIMKIPMSSVKFRIHKAKELLKDIIAREEAV